MPNVLDSLAEEITKFQLPEVKPNAPLPSDRNVTRTPMGFPVEAGVRWPEPPAAEPAASPASTPQPPQPPQEVAPTPKVPEVPKAPAAPEVPEASPTPASPLDDLAKEIVSSGDKASYFNALPRSVASLKYGAELSKFSLERLAGGTPDINAILDATEVRNAVEAANPRTQFEKEAAEAWKGGEWWPIVSPTFLGTQFMESVASFVPPIVGAAGGAAAGSAVPVVGSAAGGIAGLALGSGLADYGPTYGEYLAKKLGPYDRAKWEAALRTNPALLDEAHYYAAQHAGVVAFFDSVVGAGIARRFLAPLASKSGVLPKVGLVGGAVGTEFGTEFSGEFFGSGLASKGEDWNTRDALLGGVVASFGGGFEHFIPSIGEHAAANWSSKPPSNEEINAALKSLKGTPGPQAPGAPRVETDIEQFNRLLRGEGVSVGEPVESFAQMIHDSQGKDGPIWTLKIREIIDQKFGKRMSVAQALQTLKNNDVKEDEMLWTGATDFFTQLEESATEGGKSPTFNKADLIAHIEESAIEIVDVKNHPEYEKWSTPGDRENYEEKLLVLRAPAPPEIRALENELLRLHGQEEILREQRDWMVFDAYSRAVRRLGPELYQQEVDRLNQLMDDVSLRSFEIRDRLNADPSRREQFTESHFVQPNVLAHVRTSERVDTEGRKVFVIEEIQSDWHQKGRKRGYTDRGVARKLAAIDQLIDRWRIFESKAETQRYARQAEDRVIGLIEGQQTRIARDNFDEPGYPRTYNAIDIENDLYYAQFARPVDPIGPRIPTYEEASAEMGRLRQERRNLEGKVTGIPDAPFKSDWKELAIKRLFREAADRGITRIVLPDGAEHVRRYPGLHDDQQQGLHENYDRILPSLLKKWAKKFKGVVSKNVLQSHGVKQIEYMILGMRPNGQVMSHYDVVRSRGDRYVIAERIEGSRINPLPDRGKFEDYFQTKDYLEENIANGTLPKQRLVKNETNVTQVDLPPEAGRQIRQGLRLWNKLEIEVFSDEDINAVAGAIPLVADEKLAKQALKNLEHFKILQPAFAELMTKFNPQTKIRIRPFWGPEGSKEGHSTAFVDLYRDGSFLLNVNIAHPHSNNIAKMWGTMLHEGGHIIFKTVWKTAPRDVKIAMREAYKKWKETWKPTDTLRATLRKRDNFLIHLGREASNFYGQPLYKIDEETRKYYLHFEEFFVENIARWGTTSAKPLTLVEKYFSFMGKLLKRFFQTAQAIYKGEDFQPNRTLREWADSFLDHGPPVLADSYAELDGQTRWENHLATAKNAPEVEGVEQQAETTPARRMLAALNNGTVPPEGREMAAHADKIGKFFKWAISLPQLAKLNPHVRELQLYKELVAIMQLVKQRNMTRAFETLKAWRSLGRVRGDRVAGLVDDVMNMRYLQEGEEARHPTQQEFAELVARNRVDAEGIEIFQRLAGDFNHMLNQYEAILRAEAAKITDPTEAAIRVVVLEAQLQKYRNRPYFPAMRFGRLYVEVRNQQGGLEFFQTYERARDQQRAHREIAAQLARENPEWTIRMAELPDDVQPIMGMPAGLLDSISEKLSLSESQRTALELLKFDLAPAQSFRHRFQQKKRVPGYSMDFKRAYANYFFHGSNYLARVQFRDQLLDQIKDIRTVARSMPDGRGRAAIANFMADHFKELMDPKPDFAKIRGAMFLWALAYSPAAASLNLTQTLFTTYPFLASKFGDIKATKHLLSAGSKLSSFYKLATYENLTEPEMKAIAEGIREGVITEAMAPELAAIAEGNNLFVGFGGNIASRGFAAFLEKGAWMFEKAEQVNRRVAFRAAWNLAMENPDNRHIDEVVSQNQLQYQRLRDSGWTEREARAFVVAKDAVEATQYIYAHWAQPRFMRGKLRTVFVFKSFVQNTLFFLGNYPGAAARYMLIMGFLGGLMGLPGGDDLKEALKTVGYRLFGKDWNLEVEARKFVHEVLNDAIPADLLLHGFSRVGFGIPAVMDMLGGTVGVDIPYPSFDRSRAIGMGNISPIPLGALFGSPEGLDARNIQEAAQRAGGATFGVMFNMLRAITDSQLDWTDAKRWERAIPRAAGSVARAFRVAKEGGERDRGGATIMPFDARDPEQMFEMLGMAAGYNPTRLSREWNKRIAKIEVKQFWDARRNGLLRQMFEASKAEDKEEIQRVLEAIKAYNKDLPKGAEGRSITADTIRRSVRNRTTSQLKSARGLPFAKGDIGLYKGIDELFPEAPGTTTIDIRRVK